MRNAHIYPASVMKDLIISLCSSAGGQVSRGYERDVSGTSVTVGSHIGRSDGRIGLSSRRSLLQINQWIKPQRIGPVREKGWLLIRINDVNRLIALLQWNGRIGAGNDNHVRQ